MKFGFMWQCPWRVEWKSVHEYWLRSQLGPFYILHKRQRKRQPGEKCENCCFFIDHRDEDDPDDQLGYCGQLVATMGLEEAIKINEYGGEWTHSQSWCDKWEGGPPIWRTDESEP